MGISLSMNCPNCGGALSFEEGSKATSCPYCSLLLEVQGDDGVKKIMLANNLDSDKATSAVKAWWRSGFKARDLRRRGEVTECYPIYVPFWKLRARAAGWVCGYNERRSDNKTEKIPKEVMVNRDMEWNRVACDPGDIGIEHLHSLEGKALLHDDGAIPTFEATTSFSDARAAGVESIRNTAISGAGVEFKTFVKLHVFTEDIELVFYPIWIVRYKYSERMYFATVDGITGKVLSGRAPGDVLWRSLFMTGGMAIGGFGTMFGLWIVSLGNNSDNGSGIGLLLSGGCLVIAAVSYMFYRYGSEVTAGDVKGDFRMPSVNELSSLKGLMPSTMGRMVLDEIERSR